jgi:hypothetical protein
VLVVGSTFCGLDVRWCCLKVSRGLRFTRESNDMVCFATGINGD